MKETRTFSSKTIYLFISLISKYLLLIICLKIRAKLPTYFPAESEPQKFRAQEWLPVAGV